MLRPLFLALLLTACAHAEDAVLLIGVGEYKQKFFQTADGPRPTALPGIDLDVAMMRQTALRLGFKETQITTLMNSTATLQGIREAILKLIAAAGPNDRVLIYYSGHGARIPDQQPLDETGDRLDEVLIAYDFEQAPNTLKNVLVDDELNVLLSSFRTENVLLILDSCHSGTADKSLTLPGAKSVEDQPFHLKELPTDWKGSSRSFTAGAADKPASTFTGPADKYIALMAAKEDEYANATGGGSVMTLAVDRAVAQAVKTNSPITIEALHRQAVAEAEQFRQQMLRQYPSRPVRQTPQLRGNLGKKGINIRQVDNRFAMVEEWADSVPDKLAFTTNQQQFRPDDPLEITIPRIPRTGYLNLVQVSAESQKITVLFPHAKHPENRVTAGQSIKLPFPDGDYDFGAVLAPGLSSERVLLVAFVSAEPINLNANASKKGEMFPELPSAEHRDFVIRPSTGKPGAAMYAGKIIVEIKK